MKNIYVVLFLTLSSFLCTAQVDSVSYHHGTFELQWGSSGAYPSQDYYRYVTRFTPPYYPAQLVGVKAWFRNAADSSTFRCVAYKDTSGAANGPISVTPDYISAAIFNNPASKGVTDSAYSYYIDLTADNIQVTKGDVYAGVTQHMQTNGFLGMAMDTSNAYTTDRPWTYAGYWTKMVSWTGTNGEWGITAYFIPLTTGIQDFLPANSFSISPNPAKDEFTIYNLRFAIGRMEIYNSLGQICVQSEITNPKSEIDVSSLPAGIYFVQVISDNGKWVRKFVKE